MPERTRRYFIKTGAVGAAAAAALSPGKSRAKKLEKPYPIDYSPLTESEYEALKASAAQILEGNRVALRGGYIHVPSKNEYTSLFGWDSGWHAIAMSRIDPGIAASEVEVLLSFQEENGRVSHNTYFEGNTMKPGLKSAMAKSMGDSQYDEQGRSAMIDPPSYIVAADKIFAITGDKEWLSRVLPKMEKCIEYNTTARDLFGDGLVSVIHPWETGTDSSPAYDEILGLDFSTPLGAPKRGLLYPKLLDFNAEFDWDPREAKKRNRFVLEDICFNSITIRAVVAVANLNRAMGDEQKAQKYEKQARDMVAAIDRINWVEDEGCYFSRWDAENPKLAMRTTCSSMLPMMTGLISEERASRIVNEHLKNPAEFWLDYLVGFNAKDELDREKVYMEDLLLWRGHCIWINMNWMVCEGLKSYGYEKEALRITRNTARMIQHEGFREFYDFRNGQGKGAETFNWPALVLDMIQTHGM